jgi:glutamyl-tRNA synthetase
VELAESATFFFKQRPLSLDDKAAKQLDEEGKNTLAEFAQLLAAEANWRQDVLENQARQFAENKGLKLGKLAQPLRAALTGATVSPPIFDVLLILGRDESLGRIKDVVG